MSRERQRLSLVDSGGRPASSSRLPSPAALAELKRCREDIAARAQRLEELTVGPERAEEEERYRTMQSREESALDELTKLQEAVEDAFDRLKTLRQRAAASVLKRTRDACDVYGGIKRAVLMGELPHSRGDRERSTLVVVILLLVTMEIIESGPEAGCASEVSESSKMGPSQRS